MIAQQSNDYSNFFCGYIDMRTSHVHLGANRKMFFYIVEIINPSYILP